MTHSKYSSILVKMLLGLILITGLFQCTSPANQEKAYNSDLLGKDTDESILTLQDQTPVQLEIKKEQIEKGVTSSFLKVKEMIYLDNTQPIGKIDKILFDKNQVYVLDKFITKSLLCFDLEGRFQHSVGVTGEGPGEIRQIYDAQINPFTGMIDVWDGVGQKLMTYDKNGKLTNEIPVDIFASEFAPLNSSVYLFHKGNAMIDPSLQYKFIAIDVQTKQVKGKYFPIKEREELFKFRSDKVLHKNYYNDHYYFTDPFDYHVYAFSSKYLTKDILVDCGSNAIPPSLVSFNKPQHELVNLLYDEQYFGLIDMPIETSDHIYLSINNGQNIIHTLYNKHSGQIKNYQNLEDDLTGVLIGTPLSVNKEGDVFYSVEPGLFKMLIEAKTKYLNITEAELIRKWQEEQPLAYEIYHAITDYDNPLLVKCAFII